MSAGFRIIKKGFKYGINKWVELENYKSNKKGDNKKQAILSVFNSFLFIFTHTITPNQIFPKSFKFKIMHRYTCAYRCITVLHIK